MLLTTVIINLPYKKKKCKLNKIIFFPRKVTDTGLMIYSFKIYKCEGRYGKEYESDFPLIKDYLN